MHDDDDAKAILKRRARYVAMALAGVGTATLAQCGACLSIDAGDLPDASRAATADAATTDADETRDDARAPSEDANVEDDAR